MATFVLVHGSHVGGWGWKKFAPLLRNAGHEVWTPTLTGLGERVHLAHAQIGLATHIDDVANLLFYEDLRDVTLVGYSYGVTVIAGVAERVPERLGQLIYVDSAVPVDGQSDDDVAGVDASGQAAARAAGVAAGTPGFSPIPADYIRAHVADGSDQAWLLERMAPHPLASFTQPVRTGNPAAAALPRAFVFLSEDKEEREPTARFAARVRADQSWRYRAVTANHLAAVTAPQALADAILSLV